MLVVADSSPLIVLLNIEQAGVLPQLFGKIFIPPQISTELSQANRPEIVRRFILNPPEWLVVRAPIVVESIPLLHGGECAAICLAGELKADLLLIDETYGRKEASKRGLQITGVVGVLELAAERNLLDLAEAFDRVKQTDFWISEKLLEKRLQRFQSRRKSI